MDCVVEIIISLGLLLLTLLSAVLWGKVLFSRLLNMGWSRGEKVLLQAGLGFGIISYLIFFLSLGGFLYRPVIFIILFLPFVWFGIRWRKRTGENGLPLAGRAGARSFTRLEVLSCGILLFVFILNIIASLTPPYAGDALGYHLPSIREYLFTHQLVRLEGNVLANQPAGIDMLYVIGFAGGGVFYPKLLHCVFGVLVTTGLYFIGLRYFGRPAAALGALIFYTIPSVALISSWEYIDLGLSFWLVLAVCCYPRWRSDGNIKGLVLVSVFSGLVMSAKYTGLIFSSILFLLAVGEWFISRENQKSLRWILLAALGSMILALPWYLKNLIFTGNPFYPFLYSFFGGTGWDAIRAADYRTILLRYGMGKSPVDYLLLPWNLSARASYTYYGFDGVIGPVFLLFLPLMIFTGKKSRWFKFLGYYCLVYFCTWALFSQQIRILVPIIPFASLLAAATIAALWGKYTLLLRGCLSLALAGVLIFNLDSIYSSWRILDPWPVVSGRESKEAFLSRRVYNYPAVRFINENLSDDARVMFVYGGNAWYYCRREIVVDSIFQEHTLGKIINNSDSLSGVIDGLRDKGITHILINTQLTETGLYSVLPPDKQYLLTDFFRKGINPLFRDGPNLVCEILDQNSLK
ncbi:MAG: glycosyltransferase family 39 protein [PVC group bacterium]